MMRILRREIVGRSSGFPPTVRGVVLRMITMSATVAACLGVPSAGDLSAQGVRGWTSTTFRYLEARPLGRDTVAFSELVEEDGRLFFEGEPVVCGDAPAGCVLFRPGDVEGASVGTQDVGATLWGFGVEGLSFTTLLRGRARLDGDFVWPRSGDEIDVFLAYAELAREGWRVRLGRQRTLSGLGFSGYDGTSVRIGPKWDLTLEAYGGRSLARGVAEPRNEALRSPESFVRDKQAYLVGGFLQARMDAGTEVGVRYQREIWSDRRGLISERASLDARTDVLRPFRVRGSMDYDVIFDRVGKAELEVQRSLPSAGLLVALEGRRYVPYFELSTVWGFFSPVAYHEVTGRVAWSDERVAAWAEGGWRSYGDTETPVVFQPLEDDGWRAEAGGSVRLDERWRAEGRYGVEWGVGAFLNSGDVRLRFQPGEALDLSVHGTVFQRIEEFRLGDGRVFGGGLDVGIDLRDDLRLDGGAAFYRHDDDGLGDDVWSQTRLWSALRIDFGRDPGRPGPRLRR